MLSESWLGKEAMKEARCKEERVSVEQQQDCIGVCKVSVVC